MAQQSHIIINSLSKFNFNYSRKRSLSELSLLSYNKSLKNSFNVNDQSTQTDLPMNYGPLIEQAALDAVIGALCECWRKSVHLRPSPSQIKTLLDYSSCCVDLGIPRPIHESQTTESVTFPPFGNAHNSQPKLHVRSSYKPLLRLVRVPENRWRALVEHLPAEAGNLPTEADTRAFSERCQRILSLIRDSTASLKNTQASFPSHSSQSASNDNDSGIVTISNFPHSKRKSNVSQLEHKSVEPPAQSNVALSGAELSLPSNSSPCPNPNTPALSNGSTDHTGADETHPSSLSPPAIESLRPSEAASSSSSSAGAHSSGFPPPRSAVEPLSALRSPQQMVQHGFAYATATTAPPDPHADPNSTMEEMLVQESDVETCGAECEVEFDADASVSSGAGNTPFPTSWSSAFTSASAPASATSDRVRHAAREPVASASASAFASAAASAPVANVHELMSELQLFEQLPSLLRSSLVLERPMLSLLEIDVPNGVLRLTQRIPSVSTLHLFLLSLIISRTTSHVLVPFP